MERTEARELGLTRCNLELCARAPGCWWERKWGIQWKHGQVTEGMDQMLVLLQLCKLHQALPAAAATHFVRQASFTCLFCTTAVSVASDGTLVHSSPLCWPVLEMEAGAYSCEVSIAISKVQRIAIQSIQGTWDELLAEEQTSLHTDLLTESTSLSYLYPSSLSQFWFS